MTEWNKHINKNNNRNWLRKIQKKVENTFITSKKTKKSPARYNLESRKTVNIGIVTKPKLSIIDIYLRHIFPYICMSITIVHLSVRMSLHLLLYKFLNN